MLVKNNIFYNNSFKANFNCANKNIVNKSNEIISAQEYSYLMSTLNHFCKRDRTANGQILDSRNGICERSNVFAGGYYDPYKFSPFELRGLIPYCGFFDISLDINNYLKYAKCGKLELLPAGTIPDNNKKLLDVDDETIKKFIKCLNYSLNKLDERYGVYEGIVYRGGNFSSDGKQYYSTSKEIVPYIHVESQGKFDNKFHIIYVKNGHKIVNFQEDYFKPHEIPKPDIEKEILLSPAKYFEVDKPQYYENKLEMAEKIKKYLDNKNMNFTIDELLNKIHVWECV